MIHAPRVGGHTGNLALVLCAAIGLAACGNSDPKTTIDADSAADQKLGAAIIAELDEYNAPFDVTALPASAQADVAPVVDNLPQAGGGVKILTITEGVVEAQTDFPADAQGTETGQLICGAIYRSAPPGGPGGHRVLGEDGAVLADCKPSDANFP